MTTVTVRPRRPAGEALGLSRYFRRFLQLLAAFVSRHGHARARAGARVGNFRLGAMVNRYRRYYRRGLLTAEQIRILETKRRFPDWSWDPVDDDFQEGLRHLRRFVKREGHARVHQSPRESSSSF